MGTGQPPQTLFAEPGGHKAFRPPTAPMTSRDLTWKQLVFAFRGGARLNEVEDESTARNFHLLLSWALIWVLLLLTVVVPFFTIRRTGAAIISVVLGFASLVALYLVRTRRTRTASRFFLLTAWCLAEVISALNGGLKSGANGMVVLIIINAGWLLGRSNAIGLAVATLLISLVEAVIEYTGHPLPRYFPGGPIGSWMVFAGIILFAVSPILAILETLQRQVSALRESEERFRTIVDSVNDAIFVQEIGTGRILDVNQRACEMYGYSGEEMRRLSVEALSEGHPPHSQADAIEHLAPVRAGVPQVFEWLARHRGGRLFWVEVAIRSARVSGEDRLIVVARDITERKRIEEAHARIEEQLRQAQKMESVGRLAAGVAHDFNNLLTVINGFAELMINQLAANAPERKLTEEILKAGERAADLTSQLLAFSRKHPARPEFVDLNRLILDSRKMLEPLLGEGIELTITSEPGLGCVWADQGQMHQVLMNVVANARDAMKGRGRLHIATALTSAPGGPGRPTLLAAGEYLTLSISDTGCGMDAATKERVFEPFFTTKEVGKGTGLGLATVYGIVRQCGGWVQVESEPGRGTILQIYLPTIHTPEADVRQVAELVGKLATPSTVLLVEDQPAVRKYLATVLEQQGYTILSAGTPGEALSLLNDHQQVIRAVVSDVIMPGMNGPEMIHRMRDVLPNLKVLFISGYPSDLLSHHSALVDGCDYLPKPIQGGGTVCQARGTDPASGVRMSNAWLGSFVRPGDCFETDLADVATGR
jgi:PAS domain S-box-containing protein